MRKVSRAFLVLLALVAAWLLLVLSEWLPPVTDEQRAALAVLDAEPPNAKGERNAFAALWLLGYDVPESEHEAVLAADVAKFAELAKASPIVSDFKSTAEGKWPSLPMPATNSSGCEAWKPDCLARVRADPEASRAWLVPHALRVEHGERLDRYDHSRYAFLPRLDSPIGGAPGLFSVQLTTTALEYVDGKVPEAFARLCRNTATWRRLRVRTDTLITDMLGVAQMSEAARLYAQMLAEQPAGFEPPCPEVFRPLADTELDQCAVMRQEFVFARNSIDVALHYTQDGTSGSALRASLLTALANERHVIEAAAPYYARYCSDAHRERIARRDPKPLEVAGQCGALAWTFDPIGCSAFLAHEMPAFDAYYRRALDLDARLRLLQAAVWLRTQPLDGDRAEQFEGRPDALRSELHGMTIDVAAGLLRMNNLETGRGAVWELPYASADALRGGAAPAAEPASPVDS